MKIGIVGYGFVGKAVEFGFTRNTEMFIVDPLYGNKTIENLEVFHPDVIFVAVPTPMSSDGSIDSSIIEKVLDQIECFSYKPIVIIKSTVTPDILKKIEVKNVKLVYNPEFLTERSYQHDFVNPHALVLGGNQKDVEFCRIMYDNHSICNKCPVFVTDIYTASLVKYAMNSFLATKVLFFNQFKDIFDDTMNGGGSWDYFTKILSSDTRIGSTHLQVPGIDGRKGFGGACFPKDTHAILNYANKIGKPFTVLHEVVERNSEIRKQYKDLDAREKEQNVSFDII